MFPSYGGGGGCESRTPTSWRRQHSKSPIVMIKRGEALRPAGLVVWSRRSCLFDFHTPRPPPPSPSSSPPSLPPRSHFLLRAFANTDGEWEKKNTPQNEENSQLLPGRLWTPLHKCCISKRVGAVVQWADTWPVCGFRIRIKKKQKTKKQNIKRVS